jgi:ribosomal protein L29
MDTLPTLINALVVAAAAATVTFITRSQIQDVKEELREFKAEMREFKAEVKAEFLGVKAEFRDVRREIADLRSDLTQVALVVGARIRPETG